MISKIVKSNTGIIKTDQKLFFSQNEYLAFEICARDSNGNSGKTTRILKVQPERSFSPTVKSISSTKIILPAERGSIIGTIEIDEISNFRFFIKDSVFMQISRVHFLPQIYPSRRLAMNASTVHFPGNI